MFRVEYLTTVDQKDAFCTSIAAFNNLLKSIDGLSLNKKELHYKSLSLEYEVQTGEILEDKQRFFHLKFSSAAETPVPEFEAFLRTVRTLLTKASGRPPQILWDDISLHYASRGYPLIHELENTLRKLITKFMLINVGLGWTNEAIPKEVAESVRSKVAKPDYNYLYEVDFIQLANFLFKEYSTVTPTVLVEKLKRAQSVSDLNLEELKESIPVSNWDRYFSSLVNCESEYLRLRWEKLYERRNQVAHGRPINRSEYDEILTLCDELRPKLQQAIDNLDKVTITESEREIVSENAALSKTAGYREFLAAWNELQSALAALATFSATTEIERKKLAQQGNNVRGLINILRRFNILSSGDRTEILAVSQVRNIIVHQPNLTIADETLERVIQATISIAGKLNSKLTDMQESGNLETIKNQAAQPITDEE